MLCWEIALMVVVVGWSRCVCFGGEGIAAFFFLRFGDLGRGWADKWGGNWVYVE